MASRRKRYVVHADGACIGNPGPGGWGAVIVEPLEARREFSGGPCPETTNNRMEITAALEALRALEPGAEVVLCTDSRYLVGTMTRGWKRNANLDLWRALDHEAQSRAVSFEWVPGHSGNPSNERADQLARAAALGRGATTAHRAAGGAAAAPRSVGAARPAREEDAARELERLLRPGESVQRCTGCGRRFVSPSPGESHCSHAACQLEARRKG